MPNDNDNGNATVPAPAPDPIATVILTYDLSNGNFNIQGPIDNRMLVYGMLALAHEALQRRAIGDKGLKTNPLILPRFR